MKWSKTSQGIQSTSLYSEIKISQIKFLFLNIMNLIVFLLVNILAKIKSQCHNRWCQFCQGYIMCIGVWEQLIDVLLGTYACNQLL